MAEPGAGAWSIPHGGYRTGMDHPDDQRVRWAVVALQEELITNGCLTRPTVPLDGRYGPKTTIAARLFQDRYGLVADGWIGPATARRLFWRYFCWFQTWYEVPSNLLFGMARLESGMDPGAQGRVDDRDRGLLQYNSLYHPDISDEDAYSRPVVSITRAADQLRAAHARFGRWDCAVAAHNSPAKALQWWRDDRPPDDQIASYVGAVYRAAAEPV